MPGKNPSVAAQKWSRNLAGSTESIRNGVMSVRESPTAKAARNLDKALMNYSEAVQSGRMAKKLNAVTTGEWQDRMINKGLPRIQQGAQQGQSKMEAHLTKFIPIMDAASAQAKALPNNNINDALERVRIVITAAKQAAGKPV